MKVLSCVLLSLLLCGVKSAPSETNSVPAVHFNKELLEKGHTIYTADHDIVEINYPLNELNDKKVTEDNNAGKLFFVLADIKDNGEKDYKGVYYYDNGNVVKVLENGQTVSSKPGDNKDVFFGASDGLYRFNPDTKKAEKYGKVNDNIISVITPNSFDVQIYFLTKDYRLFGLITKSIALEMTLVKNVRQIAASLDGGLYVLDDAGVLHKMTNARSYEIEGLPKFKSFVKLNRGVADIESSVALIVDNESYLAYMDRKQHKYVVTDVNVKFEILPTADDPVGHLFAYEKKLVKINLPKRVIMADCLCS